MPNEFKLDRTSRWLLERDNRPVLIDPRFLIRTVDIQDEVRTVEAEKRRLEEEKSTDGH